MSYFRVGCAQRVEIIAPGGRDPGRILQILFIQSLDRCGIAAIKRCRRVLVF